MSSIPQILRMARAGNPVRAMQMFENAGLDLERGDARALTLKGRLLKDQAKQLSGAARRDAFVQAANAYQAAHQQAPSTYPLINAATLALLAGDEGHSQVLANQVLELLRQDPDEGETPYWREATRAEALLLLRREQAAQDALGDAIAKLPDAHEDLAATIGQFERILDLRGGETAWLERFRPPCSLHFSGLIGLDPRASGLGEGIAQALDAQQPGYVFGALAAGADIMIAEAALERGARLHVHLPRPVADFRALSVERFGADWAGRFDDLIHEAEEVDVLAPSPGREQTGFPLEIEMSTLAAMGWCLRKAGTLHSKAHALSIGAKGEAVRPHLRQWQRAGQLFILLETRRKTDAALPQSNLEDTVPASRVGGLLAFEGADCDADQAALEAGLSRVEAGSRSVYAGQAGACIEAISALQQTMPEVRSGLLIDAFDCLNLSKAVIERVQRLSQSVDGGGCFTDRASALIAHVVAPDISLEELGELRSLEGPVPLWSVSA